MSTGGLPPTRLHGRQRAGEDIRIVEDERRDNASRRRRPTYTYRSGFYNAATSVGAPAQRPSSEAAAPTVTNVNNDTPAASGAPPANTENGQNAPSNADPYSSSVWWSWDAEDDPWI